MDKGPGPIRVAGYRGRGWWPAARSPRTGTATSSVRVPGAEEMYFTAGPSLRGHPASAVVRVRGWAAPCWRGELPPIQGAVVAMHARHVRR